MLFGPVAEITKKFTAHLVSKTKINTDLSLNVFIYAIVTYNRFFDIALIFAYMV